MTLENKVALIAGGGGKGVGPEISKTLATRGAKVVINFLSDAASAEQIVSEIVKGWRRSESSLG